MNIDLDDLFDTEPAEGPAAGEHAEPLFADDDDDDNENADGENPNDGQQKTDDPNAEDPKPKKKRVLRPQPKLNGDRLCGARGIGIMEETFKDLVFAGKGHEHEDLGLLMGKMQHWAHRLFPRMPFDQVIEKIEKIGKTRQVQVNVRKVRMGMNVLPSVVPPEEDPTARGEPERDVFDELIGGSPGGAAPRSPSPPAGRPASPPQTTTSTLTEEQRERMRKNREAAQLRRMRAQFTRQQQPPGDQEPQQPPADSDQETQQQPADSEQETQFPGGVDSTSGAAVAAAESSASQLQSPGRQRSTDSAEAAGSVTSQPAAAAAAAAGSGRDGPSPASSDVEMEAGPGTETSPADAEGTSAPRLGNLHQMSETAPVVVVDDETGSNSATESEETDMVVIGEDQETSVSRLGRLHQMSETAPIEVDGDETAPIVIPDDKEAETVTVPEDLETEAIVIPDDQDTDAIMVPDDEETDAVMTVDDQDSGAVVSPESTEARCASDSGQETSVSRTGHLHQMSETQAAASAADREGDDCSQTQQPSAEGLISEAGAERVQDDVMDSAGE